MERKREMNIKKKIYDKLYGRYRSIMQKRATVNFVGGGLR